MTTGTHRFVNLRKAFDYYQPYGFNESDVQDKIKNGEICLGPPKNKKFTIKDGRYFVED